VLGSVATATLRQSGVPVLMVRPDELARLSLGQAATQPAAEEAPAAVAETPAEADAAPSIMMALTGEELDILTRALGDRFFNAPVDPKQTDPMRILLEKLRTARASVPAARTPVGAR
jgi:hypothetical protein